MKRFVFTNEKYYKIKLDEDERLKLELKNVDKDIESVYLEIKELDIRAENESLAYNEDVRTGTSAKRLASYQWFMPYLKELKEAAMKKLEALQKERLRLQNLLIKTRNDIRVLEQMKDEQYAQYMKEVAADEAKELDSHMSFNLYRGTE